MFSYDHKAGITASTKALVQLRAMKNFKPDMGVKVIEDMSKIKEDFRLQLAPTRLDMYELFLGLLEDESVRSELQHKYGSSCGFVVDLLQICQHERDPKNLLVWFEILVALVRSYDASAEVTEEIFKAFSAYFPISLRTSATPAGITAEDLKSALRNCFAAHGRLATLAFPFLMQKLDQGDAVTVSVKVDILKTIKACVEQYENPQVSVVPHIEKIWSSLKYEVRNGEVKETIDATLEVLRAIANKLDGTSTQKYEASMLKNYIELVFSDTREDLSNSTYTKQAGLLLMTVVTCNVRAYVLESSNLIECLRQNIRQPKSPSHTKDLVLLLNSVLRARMDLVKNRANFNPEDEKLLQAESHTSLETLFHDVYLPLWTKRVNDPRLEEVDVLKQVAQGFALIVRQQAVGPDGQVLLLSSVTVCSEICFLLTQSLTQCLALSSNDNVVRDAALEDEIVLAVRSVVMNYTDGYAEFANKARAEIRKRDWTVPSKHSLRALTDLIMRLAFIGCSEIPSSAALGIPSQKTFSPLQHFITLASTALELFDTLSLSVAARPGVSVKESQVNAYIMAALHAGILHFCDACTEKYKQESLASYSKSDRDWVEEFRHMPRDWLRQLQENNGKSDEALASVKEDDPEVYRQFLRLSLFIVRYLYLADSTGESPTPWSGQTRIQLANIAAFVVGSLDEGLQRSCKLASEAFNLFRVDKSPSTLSGPRDSRTEPLTLGILRGLWPGTMTEMYNPDGVAQTFMCDSADAGSLTARESQIRASIGLILANKYKGGASTSDPDGQVMGQVMDYWGKQLKVATASTDISSTKLEALIIHAMHIIAGATARQDKNVLGLVLVFQEAIASQNGGTVARSIGILVQSNDLLTSENHAVFRRFYKQWVYSNLAKPLYNLALPTENGSEAAIRYTAAILSIASNCPFIVYEDDLEPLIRLIITALVNRTSLSKDIARLQVVPALEILVEVLANNPDSLKGHLRAIVDSVTAIYKESFHEHRERSKHDSKPVGRASVLHIVMCRKLVLQLLAALPKKFEVRYLLPFGHVLRRTLWEACGDPIRELRETARLARKNWLKIE
ncbi:Dos2-interacting transcription regulator of RNA-Pol-II-domain-containing protein [Lasiosphaeria miniovina]|uniref:MMS19 nucleotide excision repair protein n=1 Tax=Lasiosphaeria miniovina TaxID=1954250 RepID=A0AA40DHR6_9PEZI|nr:Dos2-interacting transcription regulator of RNA-Pol-II-domain-containing protein [Lasiosphaeria miniovina]KAK0703610.1 Dos2-interacting transcription regulator of RNA-Pol-II-domain-containing protein [Lasiosphaeria miniovina]